MSDPPVFNSLPDPNIASSEQSREAYPFLVMTTETNRTAPSATNVSDKQAAMTSSPMLLSPAPDQPPVASHPQRSSSDDDSEMPENTHYNIHNHLSFSTFEGSTSSTATGARGLHDCFGLPRVGMDQPVSLFSLLAAGLDATSAAAPVLNSPTFYGANMFGNPQWSSFDDEETTGPSRLDHPGEPLDLIRLRREFLRRVLEAALQLSSQLMGDGTPTTNQRTYTHSSLQSQPSSRREHHRSRHSSPRQ